jgi:transcriptional regulator with XRE-family HTH domain
MKLREIRLRRQMSYRQLAKASGVALSAIQKFEQGAGDPQLSTLRKLATALKVSVAELIGEVKPQKGGK